MDGESQENLPLVDKQEPFYSVFDPFEESPSNKDKLWISIPQKVGASTPEFGQLIFSSKLQKKSKTFGYWVTRYYFLFDNYLAYGPSKEVFKVKKYISLEGLKIWLSRKKKKIKKENFDFRLGIFRSNQSLVLRTYKEDVFDHWIAELRKKCIMVNFSYFYKVLGVLGQGSYGKVYLIESLEDQKTYAAKSIAKDRVVTRLLGLNSVFNEIGALRKLDHKNIVKLKEVFETPMSIYLIIEHVQGEELYTCLQRKITFTEQECALVMRNILETLAYMHSKKIIHRDLKLENVLVLNESTFAIKLIDFGLSIDLLESHESKRGGTPGYIAPEILANENGKIYVTEKSDLFSIGCMLYRLLTGKKLFNGNSANEILAKNKECYINRSRPPFTNLSNNAKDLLGKLLEREPSQRLSAIEALEHPFFIQSSLSSLSELGNTPENVYVSSIFQYRFDVKEMKRGNLLSEKKTSDTQLTLCPLPSLPLPKTSNTRGILKSQGTFQFDVVQHSSSIPVSYNFGDSTVIGSLNPLNYTLDEHKSLNLTDSTNPSRPNLNFKVDTKNNKGGLPYKSSFKNTLSKRVLTRTLTPLIYESHAQSLKLENNGGLDNISLSDLEKERKGIVVESVAISRKLVSIGEDNSNTSNMTE